MILEYNGFKVIHHLSMVGTDVSFGGKDFCYWIWNISSKNVCTSL
jgi:hypothetical protein